MAKSSKKRERPSDEDAADAHGAMPILKKPKKLDRTAGEAEVTKKHRKVKESKPESSEPEEQSKPKKDKKEKKGKNRKNKDAEPPATKPDNEAPPAPTAPSNPEPAPSSESTAGTQQQRPKSEATDEATEDSKSKTKKKTKAKQQPPTAAAAAAEDPSSTNTNTNTNGNDNETATGGKQARFICFVGNLPFTATAESVRAHFASVHPTSVRLLTERGNPAKSRGVAFVEFGRYDHMRTCLAKFHHSEFSEGGGASPARRINVELTAGGGGKTANRQDKIKQKNAKLDEERAQRAKKEEEAKQEKAKTQAQRDEDAIHPSRRSRVPYERQ